MKRTGRCSFSRRAKRSLSVRLKEYEPEYDRAMYAGECSRRLGVSHYIASLFLKKFGRKMKRDLFISQSEFARVLESEEFQAWLDENPRRRSIWESRQR